MSLAIRRKNLESSEALSESICALIIKEKMSIGTHLREVYLAERLKVSRTPVRSALKSLEQSGVVERRPNRGYFLKDVLAAHVRASHTFSCYEESHQDLSFQLARDYLNGMLVRRFTESDIVRQYKESKVTVQHALIETENEGWIQKLPGYGWEFNDFLTSPLVYEQCYRFRILVESAALKEPTYRPSWEILAELKRKQKALLHSKELMSASAMFNNGVEFHETITRFSGNNFLLESLQKANRLRRLMEYNVHASRPVPVVECQDHLHIISLIEESRYLEAADFMAKHLQRALEEKVGIAMKMLKQDK